MPSSPPTPGHIEAEKRIAEAIRTQARQLDLSNLSLETLPVRIGQCHALQTLTLSSNNLTTLPDEIGRCTQLHTLHISGNRLAYLPDALGNCTALQSISLTDNQLKDLSHVVSRWEQLQRLYLSENLLTSLPDSIGRCSQLETLVLTHNKLHTLPGKLSLCTRLRNLHVAHNQLQTLPASLRELTSLQHLFLHDNDKLSLPADILGPTWEECVSNDVIPARPADILAYYVRKQKDSRPLNEVKLLLVGRGMAGKTSVRDRLLYSRFDPLQQETSGIDIRSWRLPCDDQFINVHVWDFAGQQIVHATHQFFLTERSIYLLVLNARADTQQADAEYWLRLISAFAPGSPILIAMNQWDENPFVLDEHSLLERYPNIKGFIPTDCKSGHGIPQLSQALISTLRGYEEVHRPFPKDWWAVKEFFSTERKPGEPRLHYMSFKEFRHRCRDHGVNDHEDQELLARILHSLGVILHYADDPRLRDTTVLDPHWVTDRVYLLLRLKEGPNSDGIITLEEAATALPAEPLKMLHYLFGLMRRFELCYPLDDEETRWLVPQVLTPLQPRLAPSWQTSPATRLRYHYKVVPEGLLPRFIVRTHPLNTSRIRWRNGVILHLDDAQALVRTELSENRIAITVQGPEADRLRLVKLIRGHFHAIHGSLAGLNPREEMEVIGHPGTYAEVRLLEQDERRGVATTIPTGQGSVPIDQASQLNTISSPLNRQPDRPSMRVFVSYSQRDSRHLDVFKQNLEIMEMNGLITTWFDGLIKPGSEWDQDIRNELDKADIIILMLSTNFLASKYIRGVEMARAIQRKEAGEAEIVSLLLEPDCGWKNTHQLKLRGTDHTINCELKKYQAIHPASKQAKRWPTTPNAFNHVEKILEQVRTHILEKRESNDPG